MDTFCQLPGVSRLQRCHLKKAHGSFSWMDGWLECWATGYRGDDRRLPVIAAGCILEGSPMQSDGRPVHPPPV